MQIEPGQCMHCDDPPCVRVCPTGASYISEAGGIVARGRRRSASAAATACRPAPTTPATSTRKPGSWTSARSATTGWPVGQEPACVETCPTKVRVFGDLDDPDSEVSRLLRTRTTEKKKVQAGTGPNLNYIID